MKNKLGFFGGCFNPLTNAHLNLIKDIINSEKLDKVYFVPMGDMYIKKDLISIEHRLNMLNLVFQNEEKMEILNISNNKKKTNAIDTFKIIDEKFYDCERYFIMGSDNYKNIDKWEKSEDLLKNYNYIILDRERGNTKDISSSIVRNKIKLGENIKEYVPAEVEKYIKENNLYKK